MVIQGVMDPRVPQSESEQIANSVRSHGGAVEYILFPDEGHGFRKTPNRVKSTVSVVEWFDKYLARK